jgi:hypothetical protein
MLQVMKPTPTRASPAASSSRVEPGLVAVAAADDAEAAARLTVAASCRPPRRPSGRAGSGARHGSSSVRRVQSAFDPPARRRLDVKRSWLKRHGIVSVSAWRLMRLFRAVRALAQENAKARRASRPSAALWPDAQARGITRTTSIAPSRA